MYLDLHPTAHARFAAYQTGADATQAGLADYYANQLKSIENQYSLGKAQVSASLKSASISAKASTTNAKLAASTSLKVAKIGSETDRYVANLKADVDRESIRTQAAVEREKIGQAREEMFRIGIPSMLIDAWTAQKNYEIARMGIGLDIAKTAAEYRSTPDKYWIAADFEAAIPALLGGDMNGPTAAPSGAPTPNNLTDLVSQLGVGSMFAGESPTTGATGSGNLYEDMLRQSQEPVPGAAPTAGTTPMGAAAPTGQQNGGGWIDALTQQGIQAWGGLDLNGRQVSQGDVDNWFNFLQQAGNVDPNDPRVVAAAEAARANGYATTAYDAWKGTTQPVQTAQTTAAPAPTGPTTPTASPLAAAGGQLNPQDQGMLAGIAATMQRGIDPFVFDKLNPEQQKVYLGGVARIGYDPTTEYWRAQTKRPGQGDPLAA